MPTRLQLRPHTDGRDAQHYILIHMRLVGGEHVCETLRQLCSEKGLADHREEGVYKHTCAA